MPLPHPDDVHLWREINFTERKFVPDPSSIIVCDRCGLFICAICGSDDLNYESFCDVAFHILPPKFPPGHEHDET